MEWLFFSSNILQINCLVLLAGRLVFEGHKFPWSYMPLFQCHFYDCLQEVRIYFGILYPIIFTLIILFNVAYNACFSWVYIKYDNLFLKKAWASYFGKHNFFFDN